MDPLEAPAPEAVDALRLALQSSGYTEAAIHQALGVDPGSAKSVEDVQVYARRVAERSPFHTLVKLFVLGLPVPAADAAEALTPLTLEWASALGLVEASGDEVRRQVAITVVQGMWFAHDVHGADPAAVRTDHVIGPGPASRTLAALTVRVPCETALDLGTGSGVQALLAARHAGRVVATDTNPRALRLAALNARLNGVGIEFRQGSFYDPVAGERFDLIASNPPFVISPETRFVYRDSELPGDAVSATVVREAAGHLTDGGFATVLCNWLLREGEEWPDAPRRWVDGTGCDAWIVHSDTQNPLSYAATWLARTRAPDYGAALDRWLDYDRRLGARAIVTGAVILRRRAAGGGWVRAEHVPGARSDDATDHILRMFRNQDYLQGLDDERELLAGRYRLASDHRVEQTLAYRDGEYQVERIMLTFEGGLAFVGSADVFAFRVLSGCDGRNTLDELVRDAANAMDVEVDEVVPVAVAVVTQMLSLGFLEVPEGFVSPPAGSR